jgi:hypothetical protein
MTFADGTYRNALAGTELVELVSRLLAGLEATRGDVDLGMVLDEALGHHLADAAAAARDDHDLALHAKKIVQLERHGNATSVLSVVSKGSRIAECLAE